MVKICLSPQNTAIRSHGHLLCISPSGLRDTLDPIMGHGIVALVGYDKLLMATSETPKIKACDQTESGVYA